MWRMEARATDNYQAFDYYIQVDKILSSGPNRKNYYRMRDLLKKAIELDPKYTRAIAWLGHTDLTLINRGWSKNPTHSTNQAEELANQALIINDNEYMAHAL